MRLFFRSRPKMAAAVLIVVGLLSGPFGGSLGTGSAMASAASIASAAPIASLTISGHGFGHGRGMGQYGAYGYALARWTDTQILSHYYGVTVLSPVHPNEIITVRLDEFDNAARIAAGPGGDTTVSEGSVNRYYAGTIEVVGSAVYDHVPLDAYVAGVVPAESPASWGVDGMAALQAQAVAARSYAVALLRSQSSICDSTQCQVYDGDPNVPGSPTNSAYTGYSNAAVTDTSGQILLCQAAACGAAGSPALAEYSSSTGGYTAGGAFPAVPDAGDATASNPNHTWAVTVPASEVDAAYPSIGALTSATVDTRNGLGDLGGRVLTLTLSGTAGSVVTSGIAFAGAVGLRSNWFTFGLIPNGPPVPVPPAATSVSGGDDGYWVVGSDGSVFNFGRAPDLGSMQGRPLNAPVVGMAPTGNQAGYWLVASDGGVFTFGAAGFHGSTGGMRLNAPVVGMASSADGGGYWLVAADGGVFSFGDAAFHGSTGDLRLNAPVVGMAPTPDGQGYWLVAADGGVFTFGDARFFGSTGNIRLAQPVVGITPTSDGRGYTLVGQDGGVFTFGDAPFEGSLPGQGIAATITGIAATADNRGYLEVGDDGGVFTFGDAPFNGSVPSVEPGYPGRGAGISAHRV